MKKVITLALLGVISPHGIAHGKPDYTGSYVCHARAGTVLPGFQKKTTPASSLTLSPSDADFHVLVKQLPSDAAIGCKDFAKDFVFYKRAKGSGHTFASATTIIQNHEFSYLCLMQYEMTIAPNMLNAEAKTTLRAPDAWGAFEDITSAAHEEPDRFRLPLNVLPELGYEYFLWTKEDRGDHVAIEGICKRS
jgi:hypothetical protein